MLYWRFATLYFFYFAIGGVLLPYWTFYLQTQGFSPAIIGKLMSIFMATRIIAPGAWDWLAHQYAQPIKLAQIAIFGTWFSCIWIFWTHDFWNVALIMCLFSFFWHASLPQFEIAALTNLQENTHRYSTIRLWGSVGFVVTVLSLGQMLKFLEAWIIPFTMLIISILLWLASLFIPESINNNRLHHQINTQRFFLFEEKFALLSACFMMQASHAVYYVFYTNYLIQLGYSSMIISYLWALSVTAEVGLLLVMPNILQIYGARRILLTTFLLAALRWYLIGNFANRLEMLVFTQCLHAATFGAFHSAAIYLLYKLFSNSSPSLGQSLYSSLSFGAGGAVGSLISGYLWLELGPTITFEVAAATAFLGAVIVWSWVDKHNFMSVLKRNA